MLLCPKHCNCTSDCLFVFPTHILNLGGSPRYILQHILAFLSEYQGQSSQFLNDSLTGEVTDRLLHCKVTDYCHDKEAYEQ